MDIVIKVDADNKMYHTFIDGKCYDARDGYGNVEGIIGDAVCTFLYDPDVDYSKGFRVEFENK